MNQFLPQPFNRSRLQAGLHLNRVEREVLDRIKVLGTTPRLLKKLRTLNPDAVSDIPDFAARAMEARKEIVTALAEERSWVRALFDIDRAVYGLNGMAANGHLQGRAACARLAARLRVQREYLLQLDCSIASASAVRRQ